MNCKKCGEKLSPKEINEIFADSETGSIPGEIICDDCFELMEFRLEQESDYSDADSGL